MISVSSIQEYIFCPLKLYLRHNLNEDVEDDIFVKKTIKRIRVDIQDLLHRNIRGLKKEMTLEDITEYLYRNMDESIDGSLNILKQRSDMLEREFQEIKDTIDEDMKFEIDLLSLKSHKAMKNLDKDGQEIAEMFFPSSMYSYLIRDTSLEIVGSCDKIEIIEGRYFPIDFKNNNPPIKGVWDGDAIKLVANALLIEQEFDTEVFVGYVEYLKIGERRQVVMDAKLRKALFKVIHEMKDIIQEGMVPDVDNSISKCLKCNYYEICHENKAPEEISENI